MCCLCECFLSFPQGISILVGFDGKPTRKFGLSWSESPTAIGICFQIF